MKNLINKALKSVNNYSLFDFGWLKISLISFGIILGSYFSNFFLNNIIFIWIIFIISYALIMYKTFIKK